MKKRNVIIAIMVVLILVSIVSILVYGKLEENSRSYEIEKVNEYNYFTLKQNNLYGVIDRNGEVLITPQYKEVKIPNPGKGIFVCYQGEDTKVFNEKKEEILTQYNHIEPIRLKNIASELMYEKSVLKYRENGKYGFINFEGKKITEPIYDEIDSLSYKEGELLIKKDEKYGVINIKGKNVVKMQYDKISIDQYNTEQNGYQYAGYIVTTKTAEGYRYGYLNHKGEEILKTEYNEISRVTEMEDNSNCYLICAKNGKYGIAKNDKFILENEYQSIRYDANNKVFVVEKSKKYGIANLEGKLIIPMQYNQIDITGIYIYAQDEQGTTVYDCKGAQANMDANLAILNTSNAAYKIKINNENGTKYGLVNKEQKQLIQEKYSYMEYLYDNYFIVSNENRKLGVIDDRENTKIEANKDSLQKIQDTDLIQTTMADNKIIQIYNKTMEKICEMSNATIQVKDHYIKIYNETETKYFSKEGKEIENTKVYPENKLFVKVENNLYGFVDKNGKVVVDCKYDKAYEFNQYGFATIKKDGKWGSINEQGQEVIAPVYEIKEQSEPSFIANYYRVTYGFGEFYYTDGT